MDEQKTTPCQTPLGLVLSSSISGLRTTNEQTDTALRNRAVSVEILFARYTAASGTDIPTERRIAIIEMLNDKGFSYAEFQAAQVWILQGPPCRYGKITLADFYPTREQLESVGLNIASLLQAEYKRGYRDGHSAGSAWEASRWREEIQGMRARLVPKEGPTCQKI